MNDDDLMQVDIKFREPDGENPAAVAIFIEGLDIPVAVLGIVGSVSKERKDKICTMLAEVCKLCLNNPDAEFVVHSRINH